jgi:hypothetical protein
MITLGRTNMYFSLIGRCLCLVAVLAIDSAAAASAPPAALNKTVTLSWSTSGSGRRADGTPASFSNINTRVIYISSAGRPFLRAQVRGRKAARQAERGPGDNSPRGGSVSLQGNKLVGVEGFASGARQYIATFDPAFSSCSLSVIDAKAGAANIKRRGPDGAMFEIDNVSTGSPTCSIQSGNAFAQ